VLRYSVLLAGILVLAGAAFNTLIRAPSAPRVLRFTALTNDGQRKGGALATDGSRIYFNETLTDQSPIIAQVSVTGGEAVPLSVPLKRPQVLDLSREGTELLIANDDGFESSSLWVQSVVGGSPRRIGTIPITDAKFGADGKSIIYGSEHDVYFVSRDGSSARKLLKADGIPFGFQFSPDGRTLRFTEFDSRVDSMSIMEASAQVQDSARCFRHVAADGLQTDGISSFRTESTGDSISGHCRKRDVSPGGSATISQSS
jgi:Tol biopolymer transport system component